MFISDWNCLLVIVSECLLVIGNFMAFNPFYQRMTDPEGILLIGGHYIVIYFLGFLVRSTHPMVHPLVSTLGYSVGKC